MGELDIQRDFTVVYLEFQDFINKHKDILPSEIRPIFEKFNNLHTKAMKENAALTLADKLARRQKYYELRADMWSPSTYADIIRSKSLTPFHVSKLLNTSVQNISQKVKRGESDISSIKFNTPIGNTLDEINAIDTYCEALKALTTYVNSSKTMDTDKLKAIDSILKHVEPEVINELQNKFKIMNGIIHFLLNVLVPNANKRIRQIIREIQTKAKAGEDVSDLNADLRQIFKELLPQSAELSQKLAKEGLIDQSC